MKLHGEFTIMITVIVTVALSVFAHGVSAQPGIGQYANRVASLGPEGPEKQAVD